METVKIAVKSCYVLLQFLSSLPSIDFREIRGLVITVPPRCPVKLRSNGDESARDLEVTRLLLAMVNLARFFRGRGGGGGGGSQAYRTQHWPAVHVLS